MSAYGSAHGTTYGEPRGFASGAVKGAAFGAVLVLVPRPVRRWMLTMLALGFGVIYTVESPSDYYDPNSGEMYPHAYHFPWYCTTLIVAFVFWGIFGYIRAGRLSRQLQAVGDTPVQRIKAAMSRRVLIAVDGTQRPPQSPTGPSRRTTVPPPAPTAPPAPAPAAPSSPYERPQSSTVGSNLPTLWIPTYSGPAQPVQRVETSIDGTLIHDHRRVDPDEL